MLKKLVPIIGVLLILGCAKKPVSKTYPVTITGTAANGQTSSVVVQLTVTQ